MTMAAKKTSTNGRRTKDKPNLPEGFVLARTRLDGFFERVAGNSAQGVLRGSFKVTGKFGAKNVFRIELTDGETQIGEGELMGPGAVIGLDETGYTSALADIDPGTHVFVRYEGLQDPKAVASKTNPHLFIVAKQE
jgi:hypothetical protein